MSAAEVRSDRTFYVFNAIVSIAALAFLGWLLLVHRGSASAEVNLRFLPAVNAGWNTLSAVLLVLGRVAIVKKRPEAHRALMVAAFASSTLFLIGYLAYHAVHGDTKFGGVGATRVFYLVVLASHVVLSTVIVPLALAAFYFAFKQRFSTHTKVTRVLHPIWLYVSVTGVAVYLMLRPYYPVD